MIDYAIDYKVYKPLPSTKVRSRKEDEIYAAMYRANLGGMSVPEIANLYRRRLTRSAIYKGFYNRGWKVKSKRTKHQPTYYRGFAFYPRGGYTLWCQKPGPYFRKSLARVIWEENVGPIPRKHNIFHTDGDYMNNDILNLECLPIGARLHGGKNFKPHPS